MITKTARYDVRCICRYINLFSCSNNRGSNVNKTEDVYSTLLRMKA